MTFLFVDHITALDGEQASGWVDLDTAATGTPAWLAIEAVGQLATWVAMARSEFRLRPVAALVGEVRLTGAPARGRLLLSARVERFDGRAILYSGMARCGDAIFAALTRGVGPMLPMEMFDDPDAARRRLAALRAEPTGGTPHVLPSSAPIHLESAPPGTRRASLRVPDDAPLFADHFPRRPVYPATLLADAQSQLAQPLAAEALDVPSERLRLARVSDFKVRAFSPPGQQLELAAELRGHDGSIATIAVSGAAEGKRIATGSMDYCVLS
jgi:3-hydroxymyristoyl/3-hydroxydecanoyl-(acyl carrier protein) dehydratase